jgi:hypothetical protein
MAMQNTEFSELRLNDEADVAMMMLSIRGTDTRISVFENFNCSVQVWHAGVLHTGSDVIL